MRRVDREVKDFDKIQQLIKDCHVVRLAMYGEEYPYVVPVNFGYEWEGEDLILFVHGARQGTKLNYLNKNNKVAVEMDTDHELMTKQLPERKEYSFAYRSLIGFGEAALVTDLEIKHRALQLIIHHQVGEVEESIPDKAVIGTSVIEIRIKSYTMKEHNKEE